jgi:Glycosyl transferases group 1
MTTSPVAAGFSSQRQNKQICNMARYLVVGNLGYVQKPDMKIFFSHPEAEFLHTGPGRDIFGVQKRPARQILADARHGKYDLVIAGSSLFPNFNPRKGFFRNLVNVVGKYLQNPHLIVAGEFPFAKIPTGLAALDCEDNPVIDNRRFQVLDRAVCYFKRELPQNPCNAFLYTHAKTECNGNVLRTAPFDRWVSKLRPISLGIDDAKAAKLSAVETAKKTDVFFAGQLHLRPNRLTGIRQLERLKSEGYKIDIVIQRSPRERMPQDEFFQRCAQAYLVWSPEGFGWDCYRHYEVGAVGSVPLMQSPPIQRHAPLMDNEHAVFYHVEGDHLAVRVRQALQNRARLVEMGQAARRHVLKWHTYGALSRYVIEETKRTLACQKTAGA